MSRWLAGEKGCRGAGPTPALVRCLSKGMGCGRLLAAEHGQALLLGEVSTQFGSRSVLSGPGQNNERLD